MDANSMTARRAFLSNFWVGTKGGLLTAKHVKRMGMARWLFDYFTRGQTGIKNGLGIFQYGNPITLEQIAADMSEGEELMPVRTVRRWLATLKRTEYILIESHSSRGLTIWINKAKDKTKKKRTDANALPTHSERMGKVTSTVSAKVSTKCPQSPQQLAATSGREPEKLAATNGREIQNSRPHFVMESLQASGKPTDAAPIPKGFIPKHLSYHNTDAATKTVAGDMSLSETLRAMQTPRSLSAKELDARRRELLLQAERIKRQYPAKEHSQSKVVELQPKEATA